MKPTGNFYGLMFLTCLEHFFTIKLLIFIEFFTSASCRILELGFGKDIEEILDILGSRQQRPVSKEHSSSRFFEGERQNLLLSATLNEKVNQLANISLENPVMIGLGGKKMQFKSSHEYLETAEHNMDDRLGKSCNAQNSSSEEYKLPTQLVQRYIKGTTT